jgi:hypothetical protein
MADQKTSIPGIYRAEDSKALINKDNTSLLAYKRRKQQASLINIHEQKIAQLEERIKRLEAILDDS